jgi:hypothetical protein
VNGTLPMMGSFMGQPLENAATPSFTRRLYTIRTVQPSRAANSGSVIGGPMASCGSSWLSRGDHKVANTAAGRFVYIAFCVSTGLEIAS